jgi:hypothetical protein
MILAARLVVFDFSLMWAIIPPVTKDSAAKFMQLTRAGVAVE